MLYLTNTAVDFSIIIGGWAAVFLSVFSIRCNALTYILKVGES